MMRPIGIAAVVVLVGLGAGVWAERQGLVPGWLGGAAAPDPATAPSGRDQPQASRVDVSTVRAGSLGVTLEMLGTATAMPGSAVAATLASDVIVVRRMATPGDHVEAGAALLEVQSTPRLANDLLVAEAAIERARATLESVQGRVEAKLATRADLLLAQQALQFAELDLSTKRALVPADNGIVRATVSGSLTALDAPIGGLVSAGTALCQIAPDDALRVRFGIPLRRAQDLPVGLELEVVDLLGGSGAVATVSLARIEAEVDGSTQTLVGWSEAIDPLLIVPGTPLRVTARVQSPVALLVDRTAVVLSDDGPSVFTVDAGVAHRHAIEVVAGDARTICLRSDDLATGDEVVVLGGYELEEGLPVEIEGRP
ncbi:efflux RND transporter periplasmic adaptor subunit [Engelhardtia mirabilis]|uniref:HlyD family secretion protein n=1 Tax=Engelhardtia mirabilis TaxID=2528011 RepID=A0A518BH99_9BACT|nr:HlyD family secretion protein [Planctomycetes bacterium Pla133]QDV00685.1 HlyD family secretion protein [Planctomycetes bacterium Pla86]